MIFVLTLLYLFDTFVLVYKLIDFLEDFSVDTKYGVKLFNATDYDKQKPIS